MVGYGIPTVMWRGILSWDVMELPTDDRDVPSDVKVPAEEFLRNKSREFLDHSVRRQKIEALQQAFIKYLRDEAGETPAYPDSDARAVVEDVKNLLRANGHDPRPNDEENPSVSVFASPEFVERLRAGHVTHTPEPQRAVSDDPLQVRGTEVYADPVLDDGQLLAIHHDAIAIPSPGATWKPYLVRHPSGVVAATVEVADE
jgi:hypothetical protein